MTTESSRMSHRPAGCLDCRNKMRKEKPSEMFCSNCSCTYCVGIVLAWCGNCVGIVCGRCSSPNEVVAAFLGRCSSPNEVVAAFIGRCSSPNEVVAAFGYRPNIARCDRDVIIDSFFVHFLRATLGVPWVITHGTVALHAQHSSSARTAL